MTSTTRPVPITASRTGGRVAVPSEVLILAEAARLDGIEVVTRLGTDSDRGLRRDEVITRRAATGPNAVSSHRARFLPVLWHQLRSPLLVLLLVAAAASYVVGERTDAVIISVIVVASIGLGLVNEYRAEKAAEALHSRIHHRSEVVRDGRVEAVDVTDLVPGDVVHLHLGDVVPADLRLLAADALECDESILTGESQPASKTDQPVAGETALGDLTCCALMGTVVHAGHGTGVVVSTGPRAAFGAIAAGLSTHQLDTQFQVGLRRFSLLLVYVAAALTASIFVINVVLHRPVLDALLFSLAIAVGITPQLLPAVVSTSLAAGSRRMGRLKVLVKRLVCIEDLGDVDVLFTDKTGTLTLGEIGFVRAIAVRPGADVVGWGRLGTEAWEDRAGQVGRDALDHALWRASTQGSGICLDDFVQHTVHPFDHDRRLVSVVVADRAGALSLVVKGAPESVLGRCTSVPDGVQDTIDREFADGGRVVAVATRTLTAAADDQETGLDLVGLLVFADPPRPDAAAAIARLVAMGVTVKIVTGDNAVVAARLCADLGMGHGGAVTGTELDAVDDADLPALIERTTVFARVSPEHKARIVRVQRLRGGGVAFLGDGVNDALALHAADVGISVDSGTDVAKDAADVILLEKDLDVLADGVAEGRRIFANTMKYVLMGTSSNFGNMFSAAGASIFLPFLPMLPSQILLNNLLYDTSQLAIPTDHVDESQVRRPSHWDISMIRRFMLFFGPVSSVFDFVTFGVMLWVFHAGPEQFRTGWFVESLATQTLVIFAIRTRRIPFFRSRPSLPLVLAAGSVVLVGAVLPATPIARVLGFQPLPAAFFVTLLAMVLGYLALIELGKTVFYRHIARTTEAGSTQQPPASPRTAPHRHLRRRAAYFSVGSGRPRSGRRARA